VNLLRAFLVPQSRDRRVTGQTIHSLTVRRSPQVPQHRNAAEQSTPWILILIVAGAASVWLWLCVCVSRFLCTLNLLLPVVYANGMMLDSDCVPRAMLVDSDVAKEATLDKKQAQVREL